MDSRWRVVIAGVATGIVFLVIQLGALMLVQPFMDAGFQAVEDPADPINSFVYLLAILVATGIILLVIKLGADWVLRGLVIGMSGLLSVYVFLVLIPRILVIDGIHVTAWGLAGLLALLLYVYPEWYVIDTAGVIIAAGGAGLFGISFGPLPAIVLLSVLAIYDAISVYGTKHMLTLAESVTDLKIPLVIVIPVAWSYSFLETTSSELMDPDTPDDGRDAFIIGVGDTVMPTILVASAAFFSPATPIAVQWIALNLPALGAMIGTLIGLAGLLWLVTKGRAHAGLPLLNGGAIIGYLVGAIVAGVGLLDALGLAQYL